MKKYLVIVAMFFNWSMVYAQQDTLHYKHNFYYGVGFSFGAGSEDGGYNDFHAFIERKTYYIAFKGSSITKFQLFGDEPIPSISDVGIVAGKTFYLNDIVNIKIGCGLAYVERISRGAFLYNTCKSMFCFLDHNVFETINNRTIGLPVEIRSNVLIGRGAAITFGFSANINSANTFCGASIGATFGRLRDRKRRS